MIFTGERAVQFTDWKGFWFVACANCTIDLHKTNFPFFPFWKFKTTFLVVIIEIDISWFDFWKEEEMLWCCWYIFIILFASASCHIDIRKHNYIFTFPWFSGGVQAYSIFPIEILFFCIYIPGWWLPYPRGVHYWSWNIFTTIWRVLAGLWKKKKTPLNFVGLFQGIFENEKSVLGGPLFASFFLYKKLLIVFFL